jgi:hypothetical protein
MGHDTDQLVLVAHGLDEPGIKKDEPGRGGKGVDLLILDYKK